MKVVTVNASKTYQVKIGSGLLAHLGEELAAVSKAARVAIVSDSTVWPIYGKTAESSLQKAGFETVNFVFPAGESSKNGTVYLSLLNFLAENQLTRSELFLIPSNISNIIGLSFDSVYLAAASIKSLEVWAPKFPFPMIGCIF